ncbi:ribosome biogenesis GTPase Der [Candidatus Saccharibacteria bacterium]|nr:ribosome biogenesis GTPase Der [Candidatus Saccharibacteria bacterium]
MKLPVVAIIGQTNAGKSSIFNRLVRKSQAIVAREAGTTRDNVVGNVEGQYVLIDTAGLKDPSDEFEAHIQDQIDDAVSSADMILIAMDATKYPNHDDKLIAKKALKSGKPTLLLLNKSDLGEALPLEEFYSMGITDPIRSSATTGLGLNELRGRILKELQAAGFNTHQKAAKTESLKLALIGRPNVGKSSLFNTLAKKQQAIVANLSGTTRDINRTEIRYKGQTIELLDTAGLRKPGKREVGIEKFSALRSLAAIEEADICCLLVDATEPHSKLDQSLAGQIVDAGKGIILVVTKTDLDHKDTDEILDNLEDDFNFIPYAPVVMTSSVTGKNATNIFELALNIDKARHAELKTADLNRLLEDAVRSHAPAGLKNTHPKLRYMVQTDTCPPWFVVYGSNLSLLHWSWKRYLERRLREAYDFTGTPIYFSFRNRD